MASGLGHPWPDCAGSLSRRLCKYIKYAVMKLRQITLHFLPRPLGPFWWSNQSSAFKQNRTIGSRRHYINFDLCGGRPDLMMQQIPNPDSHVTAGGTGKSRQV
ncbi:hypothetical protein RRG08_029918 [Elysia crispata]|uniref:Uncharacterized protein n=1 Tax=Elysia crispata TaxID=231223 RepID=A0AAE0ZKS6_9GAST|nr:hypothetical protein RRG08_029918 [Elysia crispata]